MTQLMLKAMNTLQSTLAGYTDLRHTITAPTAPKNEVILWLERLCIEAEGNCDESSCSCYESSHCIIAQSAQSCTVGFWVHIFTIIITTNTCWTTQSPSYDSLCIKCFNFCYINIVIENLPHKVSLLRAYLTLTPNHVILQIKFIALFSISEVR